MGEAKRRQKLGLPPKSNRKPESKANKNIITWSTISIKKLKSQFPAAPFVSTFLVLLILQLVFTLNG